MNEELDNSIVKLFSSLPRREIPTGDKEKVWFAIQSHLRQNRLAVSKPPAPRFGVWVFLLRFRRLAMAGIISVIVLGLMGVATKASEGSLPGERLYSVKRAAETVEKVLATNNEAKVKVTIKHAKRRLEEVQILVAANKESQIVTQTLEDLQSTTEQVIVIAAAAQPQLLDHAVELVNEETQILTTVSGQATTEVKQAVETVIAASNESISKATAAAGIDQVQGANTGDNSDNTTASPSSPETGATVKKAKPKDAVIESGTQIHGVSEGGSSEPEKATEPTEPEILPEPTIEF